MIRKVFIVHHSHTDIGYTDIQTKIYEDHANFIDRVLDYCRKTDNYPESSKFKWICEVSWTVKNYFERRPERIHEFIKRVKEGRIEITGLYLNVTELYTAEEFIRSLYFAKGLEKKHGIKIISTMNSDISGISWIIPQILSKSRIKYLSMATNPTRAFKPEIPYPFYWISPDGSKILVWNTESKSPNTWYPIGYELGLGDSYEKVSQKLPHYLERLEKKGYPYDAYCLRMAMDNAGPCLKLSQIVKEWNEREKYPQIIISTNSEFFKYMERKYKPNIPSYKLAWPDWWADGNASAAYEVGLNRNTHEVLSAAEKFFAIANMVNKRSPYPAQDIKEVYDRVMLFDEHTFGASESIREPYALMTKAQWAIKSSFAYEAAIRTNRLFEESLKKIAVNIKTSNGIEIAVFNSLPWDRTDIVNLKIPTAMLKDMSYFQIIDTAANRYLPYQILGTDNQEETINVAFAAHRVPSLGYHTYKVVPYTQNPKFQKDSFSSKKGVIENRFYKIFLDAFTGGIRNIYDKDLKRELVNQNSRFKLNQYIYEEISSKAGRNAIYKGGRGGIGSIKRGAKFNRTSPASAQIVTGRNGPVMSSIIVHTSGNQCPNITQEVILYHDIKRIDIINTLTKEETFNEESIYYSFPFNIPRPTIRCEIAGAVIKPGIDQLPGTAKDYYSIQDWVSISNKDYSIVWVTKEAPLVQLGKINTGKWTTNKLKIKNGTIFSWVMNNYWFTNFRASQGGEVTFHYSIGSCKGMINNSKASLFAQECNHPLIGRLLSPNPKGILPEGKNSFLSLDKKNISLLAMKKSEDGEEIIIRLQEIEGKDTVLNLSFPHFSLHKAFLTTITEEKIKQLLFRKNKVEIPLKKFEIVTVRLKA